MIVRRAQRRDRTVPREKDSEIRFFKQQRVHLDHHDGEHNTTSPQVPTPFHPSRRNPRNRKGDSGILPIKILWMSMAKRRVSTRRCEIWSSITGHKGPIRLRRSISTDLVLQNAETWVGNTRPGQPIDTNCTSRLILHRHNYLLRYAQTRAGCNSSGTPEPFDPSHLCDSEYY